MKNKSQLCCAIALAAVSPVVLAQEESGPMEEVMVIGSRIPRLKAEGPAPITTIDADQIANSGLTNVPDLLKALTQNGGATQSQQSFSGSTTSRPAPSRWTCVASARITHWCW